MAELHLTVDGVDNLEEIEMERREIEEERRLKEEKMPKEETKKTHSSWRDWFASGSRGKPQTPPQDKPKSDLSLMNATVAAILKDYLQPSTTLTEDEAFKPIIAMIPSNDSYGREVRLVSQTLVELAEQIPFDHPSHFKLAKLTCLLGRSPKFTRDYIDHFNVCQSLGEILCDEKYSSVNIMAYLARLYALGLWPGGTETGGNQLRFLFEDKRNTNYDDSFKSNQVMNGAVWVLFYGQVLYQNVRKDKEEDRWTIWRDGFAGMETESFASDECKKMSARCVKLMDALSYAP